MVRLAGQSRRISRYAKLSPPGTDDPVILCYEDSRVDGPAMVLVPAAGDTVWVWRKLIPILPGGYRMVAVEPRGQGRSASPAGPYTVAEMAEDLDRLASRLRLKTPVLIGHGLGARAALLLAIERPTLPAALVLASAEIDPPAGAARQAMAEGMARAGEGNLAAAYRLLKAETRVPRGMSPRERAEHHRLFMRTNPAGLAACMAAELDAPELGERLTEVRCPVLALAGRGDPARHGDATRLAEMTPKCEAVVVEGAGHYIMIERPEAFEALLTEFLRKNNLSVPKLKGAAPP